MDLKMKTAVLIESALITLVSFNVFTPYEYRVMTKIAINIKSNFVWRKLYVYVVFPSSVNITRCKTGSEWLFPATTNISANVSDAVLFGIFLDIVKERWNQSDLMGDVLLSNSSINNNTDVELVNLLMPIWAYQSAAVYLIFISVFGLLMNIVVVIVIINDPQVGPFGVWFWNYIMECYYMDY